MSDKQEDKAPSPGCTDGPDIGPNEEMPKFDFVTFVLSLHRSASCHLGRAPDPETQTCSVNLPLAQQTIDMLAMLQEKTQGNLTGEEERILSEVLYDLRMAYVQSSKSK